MSALREIQEWTAVESSRKEARVDRSSREGEDTSNASSRQPKTMLTGEYTEVTDWSNGMKQ